MIKSKQRFSLRIGSWNIEGLTSDKINDTQFLDIVSDFSILCLVETWSSGDTHLNIPGYAFLCSTTRMKHKNARRHSGGIAVYVKNTISKGISKLRNTHCDIQWIKLEKAFFSLERDLYLASVYISPEHTTGDVPDTDSVYTSSLEGIQMYNQYGDLLIQGDFNAYTNTAPDYIVSDENQYPKMEECYFVDQPILRNNLDSKSPNKSGKLLLEMCKETGLRILNGRSMGDLFGEFTCFTYNGCSLIDYAVASANICNKVSQFSVHALTHLSNHCAVSCSLRSSCYRGSNSSQTKLDPPPGKFLWDTASLNTYSEKIESAESKHKLQAFLNEDLNNCDIAVHTFSSILCDTASASAKFIQSQTRTPRRKHKAKRKPWFSESCNDLIKVVKKYAYLVKSLSFNSEYRKAFYSYRSKFRRLCKSQKKKI